jgi:hypothetical protein
MTDGKYYRDIDAEIAVKIMGFKWWRQKVRDLCIIAKSESYPPNFSFDLFEQIDTPTNLFSDWDCDLPRFSTDIAIAWRIVEKFKMYEPQITWNDEMGVWNCDFHKTEYFGKVANTAPLAICWAALEAFAKE